MNQLAVEECQAVNSWNQKSDTLSLRRENVDGFVLWTRILSPFTGYLPKITKRTPFCVTSYPHALERSVVVTKRALADI
jgi:hypothetical protein